MAAPDMTTDTNLLFTVNIRSYFGSPIMEEILAFSFSSSNDSSREEEKDHPPSKKLCQPVNKSNKQSWSVCTHSSSSSSTRSYL